MKKLFLFGVLSCLVVAAFVSCSSDDNKISIEKLILGKWNFLKEEEYINGKLEEVYIFEELCAGKKDYLRFEANGTIMSVEYEEDCYEEVQTGRYEIKEGQLKFFIQDDGDVETVELKILKLTKESLILEHRDVYDGDLYTTIIELNK